jgi:DNA-binding protein YbaB
MKNLGRVVSAVAVGAVLAVPALAEDVVVVFKTTGQGGAGTSTQYFSAERMRSQDGNQDTIFEYASGRIVNIDHEKKQWSEITLAEIQEAMKAANAQMEQMKAQMEAMPAAMREQMAKMMGGGGEVTVTKGGSREIAGYPTQEYTVQMGDTMTMQVWNTDAITLPIPKAELRKLTSFTGPMAAMAGNPMFKGYTDLAQKMSELEGLTLADTTSVSIMGRGSQSSREATEVRTGPIPASEFDVKALAAGYKKVDSPLAQMGKR